LFFFSRPDNNNLKIPGLFPVFHDRANPGRGMNLPRSHCSHTLCCTHPEPEADFVGGRHRRLAVNVVGQHEVRLHGRRALLKQQQQQQQQRAAIVIDVCQFKLKLRHFIFGSSKINK